MVDDVVPLVVLAVHNSVPPSYRTTDAPYALHSRPTPAGFGPPFAVQAGLVPAADYNSEPRESIDVVPAADHSSELLENIDVVPAVDHSSELLENIGSEIQVAAPDTFVVRNSVAVLAAGFVACTRAKGSPNGAYHVQKLDYFQLANYYS